jgi:hypothetical protein
MRWEVWSVLVGKPKQVACGIDSFEEAEGMAVMLAAQERTPGEEFFVRSDCGLIDLEKGIDGLACDHHRLRMDGKHEKAVKLFNSALKLFNREDWIIAVNKAAGK